jgi:phosphoribosyl 1,2-cyclic phosphate phosphodiesterase
VRLTLLGTGTSFGVPQIGCSCRVCVSADPRDRRGRTAAVLESGGKRILIDTPPELRLALLAAGIGSVDAVLYTHDHADHTHGIDDLRALSGGRRGSLEVCGPSDSLMRMRRKFDYVFDPEAYALPGSSRPAIEERALEPATEVEVAGISVLPVPVAHGPTLVFAYRFGPLAYVTDAKELGRDARRLLAGVEVLVLNALFYRAHPSHLSIPEAVETARAIGARRTWLTHLTHETGHAELELALPPEVRPGYDGLVIEV